MTKDEALKLALEALECKDKWGSSVRVLKERAVTSLRTALSASKIEGNLMQRLYEGEEAKSLISEAEEAITALREALAEQPAQQQESVAIHQVFIDGGWKDKEESELWQYAPELWQMRTVYTSPPAQRKPLTDEQIGDLKGGYQSGRIGSFVELIRAIEAKLKEKNT